MTPRTRESSRRPGESTFETWRRLLTIRRVVPDIKSRNLVDSRAFYVDFLGMDLAMDVGFVMTFVSPSNPTAQISVVRDDGATLLPHVSVEVADVDRPRLMPKGMRANAWLTSSHMECPACHRTLSVRREDRRRGSSGSSDGWRWRYH